MWHFDPQKGLKPLTGARFSRLAAGSILAPILIIGIRKKAKTPVGGKRKLLKPLTRGNERWTKAASWSLLIEGLHVRDSAPELPARQAVNPLSSSLPKRVKCHTLKKAAAVRDVGALLRSTWISREMVEVALDLIIRRKTHYERM